jgi:transposase
MKSGFTSEQLIEAIAKVHKNGGCRNDVVAELGLDGKKGYNTVSAAIKKMRDHGVKIPDLARGKRPKTLHPEKVAELNRALGHED